MLTFVIDTVAKMFLINRVSCFFSSYTLQLDVCLLLSGELINED